MAKLEWKLLTKNRASSTSQGLRPGKENLLWVASTITLIYGERDAILVDTSLTDQHSKEPRESAVESGKNLTNIYVTHTHGDHYFGLKRRRVRLELCSSLVPLKTSFMRSRWGG
jgi:glyoxylase-like metal-dependent hydrolase (beta-lactamase superfamily II)